MRMRVSIGYRQASGKSTNDLYCRLESLSVESPPFQPYYLERKGLSYNQLVKQVCLTFNEGIDIVMDVV